MGWQVVERKIGRAGGEKQRTARQREWDRKYGADAWAVGYVIDGEFVFQDDALESVSRRRQSGLTIWSNLSVVSATHGAASPL